MLTRRIRLQIVAFVVLALVGVSYVGARYIGLASMVRDTGYPVSVDLPESGGLFTNAEVTYRGVPVGRVDGLEVTDGGIRARLHIDSSDRIPADLEAVVRNRSAIGEQYLDLRPRSDSGPYLEDGSVVRASASDLPPPVEDLLSDSTDLLASVPVDDLRTVVDEAYSATANAGGSLGRLLDTAQTFIDSADRSFLVTQSLIRSSSTVLRTQERSSSDIAGFSRDLKAFNATLKGSDADLRGLLSTTPGATREIQDLVSQVGVPLGVLMSNLVSTAQVFGINADGVRGVMLTLPDAMSAGWRVLGPQGIRVGAVTTFFDPLPCTAGYAGTPLRPGSATSGGTPLNEDAGCSSRRTSARPISGAAGAGTTTADGAGAASSSASVPSTITTPRTLGDLMGGVTP